MLYVASKTRRAAALAIVAHHNKTVDMVREWLLLAWQDGCTWKDGKDVWQVFRKDTAVTYAHPHYNTLYVTVTREADMWRKPLGKRAAKQTRRFDVKREAAKYTVSQLERMLKYAREH